MDLILSSLITGIHTLADRQLGSGHEVIQLRLPLPEILVALRKVIELPRVEAMMTIIKELVSILP
jgi:hypothetical protein